MMKRFFIVSVFLWLVMFGSNALCEEIVYYNPEGGRYYHAKPECETIRSEYYPQMQPITVSDLQQKPYVSLKRCVYCFKSNTFATPPPYFCRATDELYNPAAPEGFILAKAGEYTAGINFPAGVYTVRSDGLGQGEVNIYSQNGDHLRTFVVSGRDSISFYLAENMRLSMPDTVTMQSMIPTARFQSVFEVADINFARYFMLLECPVRKYYAQSKSGINGLVTVYSMDAETGLAEPIRYELSETEPALIDLSGLYNHFVEFHNCLVWFTDAGVG